MPTNDGFDPDHPLPVFLVDQFEQQGIGKARDRAVTSSRVLKASILMATAAAVGIAALSIGNPVGLFTEVTASLIDNSGLKPGTDPSTPTVQSTADEAQALPPTAKDAPTRNEIAAAEPVGQDQTEKTEPPSTEKTEPPPDALFRQFQAWAAEKDAQAHAEPAQPVQDAPAQAAQNAPAQNAPAQVAENARAPLRLAQKRRHVQPVSNARAEMRAQNYRKRVRRDQDARAQLPPTQDPRAQDPRAQDPRAQYQYMQNAPAPSFLQTFGLRN
jgi:hypothetical protein